MTPTIGIFVARTAAERALANLCAVGFPPASIRLLVPGNSSAVAARVPTSEAEQPGIGMAMGGVIGGAVGAAGGAGLGAAAAATALLPATGAAIAIGLVGALLLSLGGAAAGSALEDALSNGLPKDEVFVYEDALRQGFTIVVVSTADAAARKTATMTLEASGAESVDAARERWWIGLREMEVFDYHSDALDFRRDEPMYRQGFEAAQSLSARDLSSRDATGYLQQRYPDTHDSAAFRRGYARGRAHYRRLLAARPRRRGADNV
jgi:hypothetical protein